jgi:hypothetical protein
LIDSILTEGTSDAAVATSRRSLANFFSEILGGDTSYYIGTLGRREKEPLRIWIPFLVEPLEGLIVI